MTYRITLKSNPRIGILIAMALVVPVGGVISLFFISFWGILIIALGVYIAYQILKFVNAQLSSRIVTHDEGITFYLPFDEVERFGRQDLHVVGKFQSADSTEKPHLFIYDESNDRLITIPDEYENLPGLEGELRSQTPHFRDIHLAEDETIQEYLKAEFDSADDDDTDNDDAREKAGETENDSNDEKEIIED